MEDGRITTLSDLKDEYLDWLRSRNYSPRTITNIDYNLRRFVTYLGGAHQVHTPHNLRKSQLFAWQKYLADYRTANGLPFKPETLKKTLVNSGGFIRYLVRRGFIVNALGEIITSIKIPKTLPLAVIPHARMRKILDRIDTGSPEGYRNRTVLELLYSTGIRAGELMSLDLKNVDLSEGTVRVMGKWRKERVVPVGRTAMRYLETYIRAVRPFLVTGKEKDALFLNAYRGRRLHYKVLAKFVHRHCDEIAGFPVTPHTFRRSCTTEMIRGGANLYHVKELLGHESLETLKRYTNLTIADLKKTHEKCHPRG